MYTDAAVLNSSNRHHENLTIAAIYSDGNGIFANGIDNATERAHAFEIPANPLLFARSLLIDTRRNIHRRVLIDIFQ